MVKSLNLRHRHTDLHGKQKKKTQSNSIILDDLLENDGVDADDEDDWIEHFQVGLYCYLILLDDARYYNVLFVEHLM